MRRCVVIAGGGTAGHVHPALAVARALVANGRTVPEVKFMGARAGMEATLVPAAGFELATLSLRNFRRSPHPRNVLAAANLAAGTWRALGLLRRWDAGVVVSVGGFASVPAVVAARLLRRPVVVVSYDAVPGVASRLAARFATACAVAFEGSPLRHGVVTGAAIRPEILAVDRRDGRAAARRSLGLPDDRFVVVSVGGSLGSGKINDVMDQFVATHSARSDLAVRQVIGARNADGTRAELAGPGLIRQVVAFESHMDQVLGACDLLVSRAGGSTVAEIGAVGVPAVLVPWPQAAEDHQRANARALSERSGAILLDDADLDVVSLTEIVDRLAAHRDELDALEAGARAAGRRDGAEAIARLVDGVAAGERP